MNNFGTPPTTLTSNSSFGSDDQSDLTCYKYQLEYEITLQHELDSKILNVFKDYSGEVQIFVRLKKREADPDKFTCNPKVVDDTKGKAFCDFCANKFIITNNSFSIERDGKTTKYPLGKDYLAKACMPVSKVTDVIASYGFVCRKTWLQCGKNKALEALFADGTLKLDFNQVGTGSNDVDKYGMVCTLLKAFAAAETDCDKCTILCTIINSTIFGGIGSKTECKKRWLLAEETCEMAKGSAFEDWIQYNFDGAEDPGMPPELQIPNCPGCPGCDA